MKLCFKIIYRALFTSIRLKNEIQNRNRKTFLSNVVEWRILIVAANLKTFYARPYTCIKVIRWCDSCHTNIDTGYKLLFIVIFINFTHRKPNILLHFNRQNWFDFKEPPTWKWFVDVCHCHVNKSFITLC